ncbi:MAG: hypothetical protein J6Y17_03125 [Elusimicrobiaceae bacterium]|nr:hypothetical protein [Elusimicrobiaceae bacterium]
MRTFIFTSLAVCISFGAFAQNVGKYVVNGAKKTVRPTSLKGVKYVPATRVTAQVERAVAQAERAAVPVAAKTQAPTQAARSGYLYAGIPFMDLSPATFPKRNPINKRYPSGLRQEEQLISDWLEYFKNGYFKPRDQVEAIEGMTPRQMNNIIEYLYYMPLEEAEQIILNPLRDTGRLPEFMYDNKLIPGTKRLPSGYYKNKFNENIATFVKLAEEDGTIFTHNAQLKELMSALKDYTFKQGFTYTNSAELSNGLRKNWEAMYTEISKPGINSANRAYINQLWKQPVEAGNLKVSLKDYFTQRRRTAFFDEAVPEFYLNSPKWVALENERRNLIAKTYSFELADANAFNKMQMRWVLGKPDRYLTLEEFGEMMTAPYKDAFGEVYQEKLAQAAACEDEPTGLKAQTPTSTKIKIDNFAKLGGVCQMSFSDGGYMGRVKEGYDGTSTVDRFKPVVFDNVRVVTFDMRTLEPKIVTLDKVSYVKDLKQPDIDRVRASSMVGDGLDASRDVLTVQRAERALRDIPHLRATIYPHQRVAEAEKVPYMKGGGLAAYLALFTPDFYPIKTVRLLKQVDGKWTWVPTHFVRKEVLTHAGFVHRDHLTFTEQVEERIVKNDQE